MLYKCYTLLERIHKKLANERKNKKERDTLDALSLSDFHFSHLFARILRVCGIQFFGLCVSVCACETRENHRCHSLCVHVLTYVAVADSIKCVGDRAKEKRDEISQRSCANDRTWIENKCSLFSFRRTNAKKKNQTAILVRTVENFELMPTRQTLQGGS